MTPRVACIVGLVLMTGAASITGIAGCAGDGERVAAAPTAPVSIAERLSGRWEIDPAASAAIMRTVEGGTFTVSSDEDEQLLRATLVERAEQLPVYFFEPDGTGTVMTAAAVGATRVFRWTAANNLIRIEVRRSAAGDATVATATLEEGERLVVAMPLVGTFVYRQAG